MKSPSTLLGFAVPVLLVALAGCASLKRMFQEEPLEGNPETTALVIASCDIVANFQDRGFLSSVLGVDKKGEATGGVIKGVDNIELEGFATDKVVVFPNLQPGVYRLVMMRGKRLLDDDATRKIYGCPPEEEEESPFPQDCPRGVELEYRLPPHIQEELTCEAAAGEIVFLGNLVFDEPHDPPYHDARPDYAGDTSLDFHRCEPNQMFRIEVDPETELSILKKVESGFQENAWTPKLKARIAALEPEVNG